MIPEVGRSSGEGNGNSLQYSCHREAWWATVHGTLLARILEWVTFPLAPRDLPNPGIKPQSPTSQADSLPAEPQGKPKNFGVDSLSLLRWIFPTQESNQGLLHCRWILYQLNYQESPDVKNTLEKNSNTRGMSTVTTIQGLGRILITSWHN